MTSKENHRLLQLEEEIAALMPYDKFVRVHQRLAELRSGEEQKLKLLAELQKSYVSADSDLEREKVKEVVGKIRELSKTAREEIRSLNREILNYMPVEKARELYQELLQAQKNK